VAANKAVVSAFEQVTGKPVTVPPHHEVTGAIGAAILALRGVNRYPPVQPDAFLRALREHHGDYHFAAGAGMDGVIETNTAALLQPYLDTGTSGDRGGNRDAGESSGDLYGMSG
jgi:hypothetical protein